MILQFFYFFLARSLQDFYSLQQKLHFSARHARYVQGFIQDLASLAIKIIARARLAYISSYGFTR